VNTPCRNSGVGPAGTWKPLSPPSVAIHGSAYSLTVDPTGRFVYVPDCAYFDVAMFKILPDGRLQPMAPPTVQADAHPSALVCHGYFAYVSCSHGSICQFRILSTGVLVPLSPWRVTIGQFGGRDPSRVTFDHEGRFAYVMSPGDEAADTETTIYQYRVSANGTLRLLRKWRSDAEIVDGTAAIGFARH